MYLNFTPPMATIDFLKLGWCINLDRNASRVRGVYSSGRLYNTFHREGMNEDPE
jgi:hypothetical protein